MALAFVCERERETDYSFSGCVWGSPLLQRSEVVYGMPRKIINRRDLSNFWFDPAISQPTDLSHMETYWVCLFSHELIHLADNRYGMYILTCQAVVTLQLDWIVGASRLCMSATVGAKPMILPCVRVCMHSCKLAFETRH